MRRATERGNDRNRRGFGLVEILVALAILTCAFVPMLTMCGHGNRSAKHTELTVQATLRAVTLLDAMAARPFDELLASANGAEVSTAAGPVTTPAFQEELTSSSTPDGLVVLGVSVSFELPGGKKQPRRTVRLERVVGRPDLSVAVPDEEDPV